MIKPLITLRKVEESVWKISEIDPSKNKPRRPDSDYEDEIQDLTKEQKEEFEKQLQNKLDEKKALKVDQARSNTSSTAL